MGMLAGSPNHVITNPLGLIDQTDSRTKNALLPRQGLEKWAQPDTHDKHLSSARWMWSQNTGLARILAALC